MCPHMVRMPRLHTPPWAAALATAALATLLPATAWMATAGAATGGAVPERPP